MKKQIVLVLVLTALFVNIFASMPIACSISGETLSYAMYGLEEVTLPPNETLASGYPYVVETSDQFWFGGAGTGKIWNWTGAAWENITDARGTDGYRSFSVLNDEEWFFADSAGSGGRRIFSNDTGSTWYETSESAIVGQGIADLGNGSYLMTHWGDDSVWMSDDLMDWSTNYKNITKWWIDQGQPTPDDVSPHMNLWFLSGHNILLVEYECRISGNANHTMIYQNLTSGSWDFVYNKFSGAIDNPRGQYVDDSGFTWACETDDMVYLGDSDRDCGEIKAIDPITMKWFMLDALRQRSAYGGKTSVSQFCGLAAKDNVVYIADLKEYHSSYTEFNYGISVSPDGIHWGRLIERSATSSSHGFRLWPGARHLFVGDCDNDKLYRMSYLTQNEAWSVVNSQYVSRDGTTITYEKALGNEMTDTVDLSQYGDISSATIQLIGASYNNYQGANSGFEWNNKTDWAGHIDSATFSIQSTDVYEGTYAGNLSYDSSATLYLKTQTIPWTCGLNADHIAFSGYFKAKSEKDVHLQLRLYNTTSEMSALQYGVTWTIDNSQWYRCSATFPFVKSGYDAIILEIKFATGGASWLLIDNVMVEKVQKGPAPSANKNYNMFYCADYIQEESKTTNPSVVINGQTFSYSGTLENAEQASSESITLPETGIADITSISVSGSGLVKIKIVASVGVIAEGIFLREYTNNVYVGHYYNESYTFSAGDQIVLFCDAFANVTVAKLSGEHLSWNVSSESGRTSTNKVYCGSKGEPTAVTGASSWSYDSTTRILTIRAIHSSPIEITVEWKKPQNPLEALKELIQTVGSWSLDAGIENSLTSKLRITYRLLIAEKQNAPLRKIKVFIHKVEVLRLTKLTNERADYLIAEAQRIINLITG